jgi:hypothetical protein
MSKTIKVPKVKGRKVKPAKAKAPKRKAPKRKAPKRKAPKAKVPKLIKVPKPARTAYDPHRPLEKNQLIHAQVRHFKEAEAQLPEDLQTGVDVATIMTEGQASHYIRKVTKALHESGGRPAQKVEKAR